MNPPDNILPAFELEGTVIAVQPHGRGLINDTWLVTTDARCSPHIILQRINSIAFPRPDEVMDNLQLMLAHVDRRQAAERGSGKDLRFPRLYSTNSGTLLLVDDNGDAWRAMSFIDNTTSVHQPRDADHAREAGRALGRFHALVSDLDTRTLHDTRPDFHNTPRHLERLDDYLDNAVPEQLAMDGVRECLDFVETRRDGAGVIEGALATGLIRKQTVHGDPKLDNFLFDSDSGLAVSLIDLDTIKPGLIHHDIADCLRSCCNRAGESPRDRTTEVSYDLEICRAVLDGWFEQAGDAGDGMRAEHLVAAIRLIPFELGVRFLGDHLNGNRYFRTEYPLQNLHRAATQFSLVADIERKHDRIGEIVTACM